MQALFLHLPCEVVLKLVWRKGAMLFSVRGFGHAPFYYFSIFFPEVKTKRSTVLSLLTEGTLIP